MLQYLVPDGPLRTIVDNSRFVIVLSLGPVPHKTSAHFVGKDM